MDGYFSYTARRGARRARAEEEPARGRRARRLRRLLAGRRAHDLDRDAREHLVAQAGRRSAVAVGVEAQLEREARAPADLGARARELGVARLGLGRAQREVARA